MDEEGARHMVDGTGFKKTRWKRPGAMAARKNLPAEYAGARSSRVTTP
ncbi:hypothetical protein [Pigmentiphaga litoralis]